MAALPRVKKEYQIPRGRLVFYPFDADGRPAGGRQFGNCPGFSLSVEGDKAPHYSSQGGLREKDEDVLIEITRKASITTDNISGSNLRMFLSGTSVTYAQASATVTAEPHTVEPGGIYRLGVTAAAPTGARKLSAVSVKSKSGSTPYDVGTDYLVDVDLGLLQIVEGGAITSKTEVEVGYTAAEATWEHIKSGNGTDLKGALQLIADNAHGTNRDWWFPSVSLSPTGELPLIQDGTDYSQFGLDVEVLKPDDGEAVYVDGRASVIP